MRLTRVLQALQCRAFLGLGRQEFDEGFDLRHLLRRKGLEFAQQVLLGVRVHGVTSLPDGVPDPSNASPNRASNPESRRVGDCTAAVTAASGLLMVTRLRARVTAV